jgi:hypothetical protein
MAKKFENPRNQMRRQRLRQRVNNTVGGRISRLELLEKPTKARVCVATGSGHR